MSSAIEFGKLSLEEALDLAIAIEDEAHERYLEFAEQMEAHHTDEAAQFFRFMAENEAKHGQELRKRRHTLFGDRTATVQAPHVFNVEAPEYQDAQAFMSPRQALEVALGCEVKAHAFFDQALEGIDDAGVKELFEELREEEVEHQELVRKELDKLGNGPEFDPDDFVDEPVAQG